MTKIKFHTLGCKVNLYETEAMRTLFEKRGYEIAGDDEPSDVTVINTCTVTSLSDKKSRQLIRKSKREHPESVVVAVGCYVDVSEDEVKSLEEVDLVLGNELKMNIVDRVEALIPESKIVRSDFVFDNDEVRVMGMSERTRAFVKVQDGCNEFCSYCIIPYARGRIKSRLIDDVMDEVSGLVESGYKEVVITGIHLTSYGKDLGNVELVDLLESLGTIEGLLRIRLGSIEPRLVTEEFAKRASEIKSLCPHFHLSLQSGSDSVLKRMNRKYTASEYHESVLTLRKYFDDPAITTDIIVGFPEETDSEHKETIEFVKKIGFSDVHVFKYSKREGTVAARMTDIDSLIKSVRSNELSALRDALHSEYLERYVGKEVEVLFEEKFGHTRNYLTVDTGKDEVTNSVRTVIIERREGNRLLAR